MMRSDPRGAGGEALFTGFYAERPGDRFPMAFEDFGERLARMIAVPGVGHFPMIEAQSSTREAVLSFLDGATP